MTPHQESILVFAFRYAIGRNTGATVIVVSEIRRAIDAGLSKDTRVQIAEEISQAWTRDEIPHGEEETWRLLRQELDPW